MKFNFVIRCSDKALSEYLNIDVAEEGPQVFKSGDLNWCLQTYLILKRRGNLDVQCSNKLMSDAINLIHSHQLLELHGKPDQFLVCIRADYPRRNWAQYHIVQNKNQLHGDTAFIPHWVQPGLIKRDPSRNELLRAAYSGQVYNGNLAGGASIWKNLLEPYGIEFVTLEEGSWHDLSKVDVLVAIRSFDEKPHDTKPPTKLFGAWHANIPFIGGYDSAFMQVGVPEEDYLLAKTPDEAVKAILQLKENKELYDKIVSNGAKKATLYNEDSIASVWEDVLANQIFKKFREWNSRPIYERVKFETLLTTGLLEHKAKQVVKGLVK